MKTVLITGANAGLGKETAKQLGEIEHIEKILLGCRNLTKARQAKAELTAITGRDIYDIVNIDVSNLDSVRMAVAALPYSVDGLIMNAGGTGGRAFSELTDAGVTQIVAVNLLGHAVLTEELLKAQKLNSVAIYAGSEAARGVKEMGMPRPNFPKSSMQEFIELCQGKRFASQSDATVPYGPIKYMAALWMGAMSRQYPKIRFVTMSPGATTGTEGFDSLSLVRRTVMKSMMRVMLALGKVHKIDVGAKRFVDALLNSAYSTGTFYASKKGLTGEISDQSALFGDLADLDIQNNAKLALSHFM